MFQTDFYSQFYLEKNLKIISGFSLVINNNMDMIVNDLINLDNQMTKYETEQEYIPEIFQILKLL